MAILGVSITKSFLYRGNQERWDNVYHFEVPEADEQTARDIIEALNPIETAVHGDSVNFREARAWSAGGTPEENETVLILDLTGVGGQPARGDWFATACYFVQIRTDRDSATGKPVYLSKYLRSRTAFGETITQEAMTGREQLPGSVQDNIFNYMNDLTPLSTSSGDYNLAAPSGRVAVSGLPEVDPYIEDHELRY